MKVSVPLCLFSRGPSTSLPEMSGNIYFYYNFFGEER
jgi:hypothetical protein